ncbi:MAG: tetratricopeptide repeat protein, partial [Candidatus Fermentibacteraceae bacterium]|nr:tetratricopeptide repeat protein [Candidatus Fermentibacteraceae bacterium]
MNFLLCISLLLQTAPSPAELGNTATDLFLQGEFGQAAGIFQELFSRMPHNGRIAYNLAAAGFLLGSYADADSLLGMIGEGIGTDTLNSATAISDLALAIQYEDYGGVEAAVEALRGNVSSGDSPGCDITALEAGINWLDNHEPPEDQDQQQ